MERSPPDSSVHECMRFSRQEYWSGLPCPPAEDLYNLGTEPGSPVSPELQVDFLPLSHRGNDSHYHLKSLVYVNFLLQILFRYWCEVKGTQSCPILYNPMGYAVHGILQARILEWVAIPFSRQSSQLRDQTQVSRIAGGFFTSWDTREAHWFETLIQLYKLNFHLKKKIKETQRRPDKLKILRFLTRVLLFTKSYKMLKIKENTSTL